MSVEGLESWTFAKLLTVAVEERSVSIRGDPKISLPKSAENFQFLPPPAAPFQALKALWSFAPGV